MAEHRLHGTYDLINYARSIGSDLRMVAMAIDLPMIYLQGAGRRAGFVRFLDQDKVNRLGVALADASEATMRTSAGLQVM